MGAYPLFQQPSRRSLTPIAPAASPTCVALACFTTGILVMIVLLVLTPVFKNMPNSAQGAIIISGVRCPGSYSLTLRAPFRLICKTPLRIVVLLARLIVVARRLHQSL